MLSIIASFVFTAIVTDFRPIAEATPSTASLYYITAKMTAVCNIEKA